MVGVEVYVLSGETINVSSTYLNYNDGFNKVDANDISLKNSMYMLANTGNNGDPTASLSCHRYMSDPILK